MAQLAYRGEKTSDSSLIRTTLAENGIHFDQWPLQAEAGEDADILKNYDSEIEKLKKQRGYVTADLVALRRETPNLDEICAKFSKEHHHTEDEVRFVVEGAGVFELADKEQTNWLKLTAEAGDLIVIPAGHRHSFYLTEERNIRCIRLFKNSEGWNAIYDSDK